MFGSSVVEGNLEEFREVQPGVWEKWNIQNSGFQIYGYNGGTCSHLSMMLWTG